jgi:hypothetical protein
MWEGLKELIWEIIIEAWCWVLQKLFELAVKVLIFVTDFFPDVPIPDWLVAPAWSVEGVKLIAWLIPTGAIGWALLLWAVWEVSDTLAIYLYRSLFR